MGNRIIVTSERVIKIGDEDCAHWRRGCNNVGIIDINYGFLESRDTEELSISDAEAFANAVLEVCKDARENGLKER